jgi:hypothetical protein
MNQDVILRMTGKQHAMLRDHLFPGDGLEAVAIVLCGHRHGDGRYCLSVFKVIPIPHSECERAADRIKWKTDHVLPLLEEARQLGASLVKIHSHPGGYRSFSDIDDVADRELFECVGSWLETDRPHASVVMLPDGSLFGRAILPNMQFIPIELICVAGDSIQFWFANLTDILPAFTDRHTQVLGEATVGCLRRLRCAVVGCSGTGSPLIEQLYRLGVGEVVLVDPEFLGMENLNRILNSRRADAGHRLKVDVQRRAIENADLGTVVTTIGEDLCRADVIKLVAECDVLFGCVDSVYARHVLNKIASTYCIPYFDVGVRLVADGNGGIEHVTGAVHYLQPDGSSLLSRNVFSTAMLSAEAMLRSDPESFESRRAEGYIEGADVPRPAVIPVNMVFAGLAVFEFLCRLHPLRDEPNGEFASQRISLSHSFTDRSEDGERCLAVSRYLGRGDMLPLLGMPEFSETVKCSA